MRSDFTKDKNIKVKDVCKYFGKTQVLDHVNMECRQGEIVQGKQCYLK